MISNSGHIHSVVNNIYVNNVSKTNPRTENSRESDADGDKIVLSNEGQDFAGFLNKLRAMPEVRDDLVKNYRTLINNNNYQVDADKLANNIVNNVLF
ncbi:flagellar biosynthesis anti-sigma factor FlgM [Pectinatus cerevisiiphilus]|uniref:Negative regulator of flagellin synthesis n=1 Tax=Pectinatus cerevisiiphilus TaxID=86956 RepID=A0A4R3K9R0_9FIRM|nr:flagellar biosynthesis anti-sigma factor FlgM [Pectinatus cerevisiiphilus]TCS79645.1 FlgM family anti-sigma-28 factor [Pectinatus cerevisiiphilus]